MRNSRAYFTILIAIYYSVGITNSSVFAEGTPFNLPAILTDSNTEVTFKVDSTWHLIEGEVKGVTGTAEMKDPQNPLSVTGKIFFPLSGFSTNRVSRDERLRDVMGSAEFPHVSFEIVEFTPSCGLDLVKGDAECSGYIVGNLRIRNTTRTVTLPTTFSRKMGVYSVHGAYPITWAEFGVEDPSILVAKLDPVVVATFSVKLK